MSRHRISEASSSSPPVVWESYHKSILVHRALKKKESYFTLARQKQNKQETKNERLKT